MKEKERNERIRELTSQKARLAHKLHLYKTFGPHMIPDIHKHTDYENAIKTQINVIDTKLFLLG